MQILYLLILMLLLFSFIPLFKRAPTVLTYIIFPITTIMIFISHLFEKSFMVVVVFIISRFRTEGRSLKDSIRVVLFSSGFCALFQFVASLVSIELNYVLWILQTWANILMIIGIMRLQDRIIFSSKQSHCHHKLFKCTTKTIKSL